MANYPPNAGGPWQPYGGPPPRNSKSVVAWMIGGSVAVLLLLIGLAVLGVRAFERKKAEAEQAREENAKRVLPDSDYDATADLVDEDFKVKLKWPGKGSKVLRQAEASQLTPDSLGAIVYDEGCQLVVVGDYNPGVDLLELAKSSQETSLGTKTLSPPPSSTTFHGREAATYTLRTTFQGIVWDHEAIIIERDGWVLRFTAIRHADAKCGLPVIESVTELLPGEVKGRSLNVASPDHAVPQYRLASGVFESLSHRIRLQVPKGASLLVGEVLAEQDREAAANVGRVGQNLFISSTPVPPVSIDAYRTEFARSYEEANSAKTEKVQVAGVKGRAAAGGIFIFEPTGTTLWFTEIVGSRLLTYRVVHSPKLRDQALAFLNEAREGTDVLTEAELEALASVLPQEHPTRLVAPNVSLRSSKFVEYTTGFTLKLPRLSNIPSLGDSRAPELLLAFARPDFGVETTVWMLPNDDERAQHDKIAAALTGVAVGELTREEGKAVAGHKSVSYDYRLGGIDARVDIISITGKKARFHVATFGLQAWLDQAREATDEMVRSASFGSGAIEETVKGARSIENVRFGFKLELPEGSWTTKDSVGHGGPMVVYEATGDKVSVAILAVALDGARVDVAAGMVEQTLVSKLSSGTSLPERSPGLLGKLPATRIKFSSNHDMVIARVGGTVFVVSVESTFTKRTDPGDIYRGFSIIE